MTGVEKYITWWKCITWFRIIGMKLQGARDRQCDIARNLDEALRHVFGHFNIDYYCTNHTWTINFWQVHSRQTFSHRSPTEGSFPSHKFSFIIKIPLLWRFCHLSWHIPHTNQCCAGKCPVRDFSYLKTVSKISLRSLLLLINESKKPTVLWPVLTEKLTYHLLPWQKANIICPY